MVKNDGRYVCLYLAAFYFFFQWPFKYLERFSLYLEQPSDRPALSIHAQPHDRTSGSVVPRLLLQDMLHDLASDFDLVTKMSGRIVTGAIVALLRKHSLMARLPG